MSAPAISSQSNPPAHSSSNRRAASSFPRHLIFTHALFSWCCKKSSRSGPRSLEPGLRLDAGFSRAYRPICFSGRLKWQTSSSVLLICTLWMVAPKGLVFFTMAGTTSGTGRRTGIGCVCMRRVAWSDCRNCFVWGQIIRAVCKHLSIM